MKKTARLFQIACLCLISSTVAAQYIPNSTQAFQFAPVFNPAFSGIEGYKDLKLSYRYQWTGFGADAPKFINLSYNFRVKEPIDLSLHALRTSSATTKDKNDNIPKMKKVIHGMGINFFQESVGAVNRIGGGVNYSFHYPITNTLRLATGISALIDNTKINLDKLYFGINGVNPDPFYQQLVSSGSNHTELNIRAGVLLYSPRYYVGLSYFPLVYTPLKTSEITVDKAFYKGSIQAGAAFEVSPTINMKPSILALWQQDNKFAIDYNLKVYFEQKLWIGASYRNTQSLVGMLGFNFNELIGASYAFEFSTNGMQQFSDGSHELVLSVRLNNFKRLSPLTW